MLREIVWANVICLSSIFSPEYLCASDLSALLVLRQIVCHLVNAPAAVVHFSIDNVYSANLPLQDPGVVTASDGILWFATCSTDSECIGGGDLGARLSVARTESECNGSMILPILPFLSIAGV